MQQREATDGVVVRWAVPRPHAELAGWLDETERVRLAALRQSADRDRFATARAALKTLVGTLADVEPHAVALTYPCPLCGRPHGRPQVAGPGPAAGLAVSIAHADDRVLVAATWLAAVGVDVEGVTEPRPDLLDVARIALSPAERDALAMVAVPAQERAVLEYWVRKEAVLKAAGVGLRGDPARVHVSPPDQPPALVSWDDPDALRPTWMATLDVGPTYTAALAVAAAGPVAVELSPWAG